ncbi:hypothetical protein [Mangrovibacterium lignilyticum]|uniref:hypothetical protein n=1 Tax=Mangrovibacterium lignilyticum TaxID=2668052 RepID=UPI0013D29468|nr:hypothetical protein [Mangrovibacterium lignilyticum]
MKKIYLLVLLALSLASCHKDIQREEDEENLPQITEESFQLAYTESEIDMLTEAIEVNIDVISASSEILDGLITKAKPICPTISVGRETEARFPQTVTIDYQDGCKGKREHDISGIVYIYKTSSWMDEGATQTITFENFVIDDIQVSGTLVITFQGGQNGVYGFSASSDLTFTWSDGFWIKRVQEKTRSFIAGFDTPDVSDDNILQITGSITDTTSEGMTYSKTIVDPLTAKLDCSYFVSGQIDIQTNGELVFTLDYGDGTCDNKATITKNNDSKEINLDRKRTIKNNNANASN